MKKLSKLHINPNQLIKENELMNLKGGINCWCWLNGYNCGTGSAPDAEVCHEMCHAACGPTDYVKSDFHEDY